MKRDDTVLITLNEPKRGEIRDGKKHSVAAGVIFHLEANVRERRAFAIQKSQLKSCLLVRSLPINGRKKERSACENQQRQGTYAAN